MQEASSSGKHREFEGQEFVKGSENLGIYELLVAAPGRWYFLGCSFSLDFPVSDQHQNLQLGL